MDALTNAHTRRGGIQPPTQELPLASSPDLSNLDTGVSSGYAYIEGNSWFVFRAIYGQAQKAFRVFKEKGFATYIPMSHVIRIIDGKKRRILKPLLPNIVFAYMTREQADGFVRKPAETSSYLRYYLDKTVSREDSGYHPPLVVRYSEMMNFINVTRVDNDHIMIVSPEYCHYKSGDKVKIIDGDFQGIIGKVARIAGQQRVVVEIDKLCLVATAYIPTAFLEPYTENQPNRKTL